MIFQTLPIAFGQMPGGTLVGFLFFILLVFAAWTSAISLVEPLVAWLVENRGYAAGSRAAGLTALAGRIFGNLALLSLNLWQGDARFTFFGKGFLDLFDWITSNVMLPLGGLLISVFAAWIMTRESSRGELGLPNGMRISPVAGCWSAMFTPLWRIGLIC
ncbi:SLC5/6 family protein [Thiohalobacter thiocyanaticus]|uniref:hypothetical protein n=1 Tax=Thiohalobacter thiocyanaticus TaxID=585455 RepID=UPI00131A16CF|nr:hypothetical protein [Thiohalobacter thiocyanaticus]